MCFSLRRIHQINDCLCVQLALGVYVGMCLGGANLNRVRSLRKSKGPIKILSVKDLIKFSSGFYLTLNTHRNSRKDFAKILSSFSHDLFWVFKQESGLEL